MLILPRRSYPLRIGTFDSFKDFRDSDCAEIPGVKFHRGEAYATEDAKAAWLAQRGSQDDACRLLRRNLPVDKLPGAERLRELLAAAGITPWKHQRKAIPWLASRGSAILADEQRLGKTLSIIASAVAADCNHSLILCPALARLVWAEQISKLDPDSQILLLYGRRATRARFFGDRWFVQTKNNKLTLSEALACADWIISTPDILQPQFALDDSGRRYQRDDLRGWASKLQHLRFDLAVLDEFDRYTLNWKGHKQGNRLDCVEKVCFNSTRVWLASGTPTHGRRSEYYMPIRIATGCTWGDKPFKLHVRYCAGHHEDVSAGARGIIRVWSSDGESNDSEFLLRLNHLQMRRTREDVSEDMPPKIRIVQRIELTDKERTQANAGDYHSRMQAVTKLKIPIAMPEIVSEACSGRKIMILTKYKDTSWKWVKQALEKEIKKARKRAQGIATFFVNGDVSPDNRFAMAAKYREHEDGAIWLATTDSVPGMISLRGTDTVHHFEIYTNPAPMFQAEDRGLEIGVDLNGYTIVHWVADACIDDAAIQTLLPKIESIDKHHASASSKTLGEVFGPEEETIDQIMERLASLAPAGLHEDYEFED